ncbi:MAG: hypothetical protein PHY54_03300 [Methylococcales bacterium]|nr:hypothetical protein [Methylococcales bacterium]
MAWRVVARASGDSGNLCELFHFNAQYAWVCRKAFNHGVGMRVI